MKKRGKSFIDEVVDLIKSNWEIIIIILIILFVIYLLNK